MSRLVAAAAAAALTAGVLIACGNVYADPIEAPYGFAGFDASPLTLPPNKPVPCPNSVHENGPCDTIGAACEFGASSDPDCNSTFSCVTDTTYGAYWTETKPPRCAGKCPDPSTIVDGAPCTLENRPDSGIPDDALELQCVGPTSLCACTTGPDGAHVHERKWVCVPAGDGCPMGRPNAGKTCLGDRTCDYGSCQFKRGTGMICEQEVWQVEAKPCP